MSLSYGFITSTNNDYYKHKSSNPILKLLEDAPPSYSFVLAEKYQQERLGEKVNIAYSNPGPIFFFNITIINSWMMK
jgi:hypothetical protein